MGLLAVEIRIEQISPPHCFGGQSMALMSALRTALIRKLPIHSHHHSGKRKKFPQCEWPIDSTVTCWETARWRAFTDVALTVSVTVCSVAIWRLLEGPTFTAKCCLHFYKETSRLCVLNVWREVTLPRPQSWPFLHEWINYTSRLIQQVSSTLHHLHRGATYCSTRQTVSHDCTNNTKWPNGDQAIPEFILVLI